MQPGQRKSPYEEMKEGVENMQISPNKQRGQAIAPTYQGPPYPPIRPKSIPPPQMAHSQVNPDFQVPPPVYSNHPNINYNYPNPEGLQKSYSGMSGKEVLFRPNKQLVRTMEPGAGLSTYTYPKTLMNTVPPYTNFDVKTTKQNPPFDEEGSPVLHSPQLLSSKEQEDEYPVTIGIDEQTNIISTQQSTIMLNIGECTSKMCASKGRSKIIIINLGSCKKGCQLKKCKACFIDMASKQNKICIVCGQKIGDLILPFLNEE